MKLKKVLSIILSSAMIVSVAPVESFAADLDVAVKEFSDETDEPVIVENEDETLGDESAEVEIQDEDEQQDIDFNNISDESAPIFDSESNIEAFSDDSGKVILNGTIGCEDISDALKRMSPGEENTISLNESIDDLNIKIPEEYDVCIDLNGHSLTTNQINNEGKCVIKNSSQNGFIKNKSHFRGTQHLISNLGTMELYDVNIHYSGVDSSGVPNVSYAPNVTVLYNQGTCLANGIKIDSDLTYSSTSTCTSLMYNYGIYNEDGNIKIENYKCNTSSKLNVRNAKLVASYQYGIYCKGGEVTYISGTINNAGSAVSFVGDAVDSRYQIYNSNGILTLGIDDDIIDNENPTLSGEVHLGKVNVYDGNYEKISDKYASVLENKLVYNVDFYDNENLLNSQKYKFYDTVEVPDDLQKKGYEFDGWTDEYGKKYDFSSKIVKSKKLYAKWNPIKIEKLGFLLSSEYIEDLKQTLPYLYIGEGQELDLSEYIEFDPVEHGEDETIECTSKNDCVKTLENGKIKGLKAGWEIVTVRLKANSNIYARLAVRTEHVWAEDYTIDKLPTCVEEGEANIYCIICSEKKNDSTITLPKVKHSEVIIKKIAPTCETEGWTEGSYCSVCDQILQPQKVIPATGHKFSSWKTISQATVFSSEQQTRSCSACGKKEQREVGSKLQRTITVTATSLPLKTKQKTTVLRVSGLAAGDSIVSWKSNNTKIAKVSGRANGTSTIIAGSKIGKAQITITLKSGLQKVVKVTVQKSAVKTKKITGVAKNLKLKRKQKAVLRPVLAPVTSKQKITYKSSNSKVASVNSKGQITAKKKGTAVITVKSGSKTVKCKVSVK